MKKRINDLLNGTFEYEPEGFEISEEKIEGKVLEGNSYRGRFSVKAHEGRSLQGFLYSTNARMGFEPSMFFSGRETFHFEVDTRGMKPGSCVEGAFIICTDSGEVTLPYCIRIVEKQGMEGRIETLSPEEFVQLAKMDFGKAYVLFRSKEFAQIVKNWEPRYFSMYEGILGTDVSYQSLEEFLTGCGLKEALTLSFAAGHVCHRDVEGTTREEIRLSKNTWGFSQIQFSSDNECLTIERPHVTTDEFVGSVYGLTYMIHKDKLHAGRNFARITAKMGSRVFSCAVEVRNGMESVEYSQVHMQKQELMGLFSSYIDHRAGRIGYAEWLKLSKDGIQAYRSTGGTHIFADFYEVYVTEKNEEHEEAKRLFGEIAERKKDLTIPAWRGCYLALSLLWTKEKEQEEDVQTEVERLYMEHQENWILQWLMFYVNGHLIKNDTKKLELLRRQYLYGCKSPMMYLEAYDILKKEPLMLRSLGEFEIHLLRFLCREHLLDREICGQTAQLACRFQGFHRVLFGVLTRCYEVYPTQKMLTAICSMLIKGQKNEREYAKWFELGVLEDVRITGLYEYYVETMEEVKERLLPQSIRMYFTYHNTLDYGRKAAIYANIIKNREKDPHTYENYRPEMELFMEEQLQKGRINEDLALIYEKLLTRECLTTSLVKGLEQVLFACEITCKNPMMKHVAVIHEELLGEEKVMLNGGKALVHLYTADAAILLEDKERKRYGNRELYTVKRLLASPVFEGYVRELSADASAVVVHDCFRAGNLSNITEENVEKYVRLMKLPGIKDSYREKAEKNLLQFFGAHPEDEHLAEFLLNSRQEILIREEKGIYTELLVKEGLCSQAYEVIASYGTEGIAGKTLVRICTYKVQELEGEEDRLLLAFCAQCFLEGIYEEIMLSYLLKYYEGPAVYMKKLWEAGTGFELDTFALDERILTMLLFTRRDLQDTEKIFADYWKKDGKAKILRAYVTLMSYRYFVKAEAIEDTVFAYIEQVMLGNVSTADVCRLALLKYFTEKKKLTQGQKKWLYYLLGKYTDQGMYFAFYDKLPEKLKKEFGLYDKFVVEYRTNPNAEVTLHYQINEEKEESLLMTDAFEGIFTKEFTLFYQDRISWYVTEETDGTGKTSETDTHIHKKRASRGSHLKYDLINRLIEAEQKKDEKLYQETLDQLIGQQYLTEELFGRRHE